MRPLARFGRTVFIAGLLLAAVLCGAASGAPWEDDIRALSAFSDRSTGSEGQRRAAAYINGHNLVVDGGMSAW